MYRPLDNFLLELEEQFYNIRNYIIMSVCIKNIYF